MRNTKKIITSGILAVLLGSMLSGCNMLSSCNMNNETEETSAAVTEQSAASESDSATIQSDETTVSKSEASVTSSESGENGGGNPDNYTEIDITISESRYYYDNSEISFEELIELFDSLDKNDTVNIHDDYASDKAFENLTSILEEREIPYTAD